jgi:tRNA G37 N-methylase Trm5
MTEKYAAKRDFLFKNVPPEQRDRLLLDHEASYSVTDMHTSDKITRDLARFVGASGTVCDATACVGGNTYSFSKAFRSVTAVELNPMRFDLLVHNLGVLGVRNVACVRGDALDVVPAARFDACFVDCPWGGPDYKKADRLQLSLSGVPLAEACRRLAPSAAFLCLKTPTNFDEEAFVRATADFLELVWNNAHLRKIRAYIFRVRARPAANKIGPECSSP